MRCASGFQDRDHDQASSHHLQVQAGCPLARAGCRAEFVILSFWPLLPGLASGGPMMMMNSTETRPRRASSKRLPKPDRRGACCPGDRGPSHPRTPVLVVAVSLFYEAPISAKTKRGFLSTTQSQPQLFWGAGGRLPKARRGRVHCAIHHQANPGSAWWRDRAFQRNSTSRAFATGPARRWAAKPPSHRADKPPSAQAPGTRAPLVRTDPKDRSRRAPRMRS